MRKIALAAALCTPLLSGCAAMMAKADDKDCREYGAEPGTGAYFQCRMAKSSQHEIVQEQSSEALMATGMALYNSAQ
jgi:hypothetical protein